MAAAPFSGLIDRSPATVRPVSTPTPTAPVDTAVAGHDPLILASGSPRRRELLAHAGVVLEVHPAAGVDETWAAPEHPVLYARRLARAKAEEVANRFSGRVVLGADTTVWNDPVDGPLGKPPDRDAARVVLGRLLRAGRHAVTTAFAIVRPDGTSTIAHATTEVWLRTVTGEAFERYLDGDDWRDKAGGYGIQSDAQGWVREIAGSYTNVVGLPLAQVLEALVR